MYFPSSKWNVISKAIFIVVKYILDSLPSRPFLYKLMNFFIIAKSTDCNFKGIRKILPPSSASNIIQNYVKRLLKIALPVRPSENFF